MAEVKPITGVVKRRKPIRRPSVLASKELSVINRIGKLLAELTDDEARERVIRYFTPMGTTDGEA